MAKDPALPKPPARAPLPQWWWDRPLRVRRMIAAGLASVLAASLAALAVWFLGGEPGPRAFVAALPNERVKTWDELAECESEQDWDLDSGNGYFGGLQITAQSWAEAGGEDLPHEASREEQIMRAETILKSQGWGAWPRCSASLGLG